MPSRYRHRLGHDAIHDAAVGDIARKMVSLANYRRRRLVHLRPICLPQQGQRRYPKDFLGRPQHHLSLCNALHLHLPTNYSTIGLVAMVVSSPVLYQVTRVINPVLSCPVDQDLPVKPNLGLLSCSVMSSMCTAPPPLTMS